MGQKRGSLGKNFSWIVRGIGGANDHSCPLCLRLADAFQAFLNFSKLSRISFTEKVFPPPRSAAAPERFAASVFILPRGLQTYFS
jgi:hypothetical protein